MRKGYFYSGSSFVLFAAVFVCLLSSCKTGKYFRMPTDEFRSDAYYFRAIGQADDIDIQKAKSKAVHIAKVEIARNIRSVCQLAINNYIVQSTTGNKVEMTEKFESVSTETVSESLTFVEVKDVFYEKKKKSNLYTCYAKVEMPTAEMLNLISSRSSEKMDFNPSLFKQEYNKVLTQIKDK